MYFFEMVGFDRLDDWFEREFGDVINWDEERNGLLRFQVVLVRYINDYWFEPRSRLYVIDRTVNGVEEDFDRHLRESYPYLQSVVPITTKRKKDPHQPC